MENLSGHNAGHGKKLSNSDRKVIRSALNKVGYSNEMIVDDVGFVREGGKRHEADMVAYSSILRRDTDTAVMSIKGTENSENVLFDTDISPFRALATPIIILAEYRAIRGKDEPRVRTFGLCKDAETFNQKKATSKIIPLSRFKEYLKDNQDYFTPRRLEKAKLVPEQLTIFDIAPNLMKQAIDIADKELVDRFEKGVREIIQSLDPRFKKAVINGAIALLGARILRDRRKLDWPLDDGTKDFLSHARTLLPGYFNVPAQIAAHLDPLLKRLNASFNFSQVSLDMVGKFYESAFVTKELRKKWGIHYTKSLLAKTLLSRIPIEELQPEKRILADPTCGSGSLLTAGYERLASASYLSIPKDERHRRLVESIFGNDKDGFAAEVARMTLMLFHPPHQNNWKVTGFDIEADNFIKKWRQKVNLSPSIIVANPPFGGIGGDKSDAAKPRTRHQKDRSALILNRCLDILPEGGLLGIILTETILDQLDEKSTRHRLCREYQVLEQWDIPAEWFEEVNRPAIAWVIRKAVPSSKMVYVRSLSDVPSPGRDTKLQGIIRIDTSNPPDNLVPTVFNDILTKIEMSQNRVEGFYYVMNGLQPKKTKITESQSMGAHPWSGTNVRGTNPFTDLSDGRYGWLELIDDNFGERSQRKKLRKHLKQNEPMVTLRANRNVPLSKYKWSSIALLDVPHGSIKVIAPSENYHVIFSKCPDSAIKERYIYALWAILNHTLASIWFHERLRGPKIPIPTCKKFPLPNNWNSEHINSLSYLAKELIITQTIMNSKPLIESNESSKIEKLVDEIDDIIYRMYEINKKEKGRIDFWYREEPRPLLGSSNRRKIFYKTSNNAIRINYEVPEWETTYEILEVDFDKNLISLTIDGLIEYLEDDGSVDDKIILKIIPAMPGWLLEKGSVGWVELTTNSAKKLIKSPEKYIIGFYLHKNAYKTQDEIDKALQLALTSKMKKAEANG
ncbi:MAG: N-6 DNA methylase [Deltaproteobacteria bacterium]|nr:N-6 DNA methylase [Deltaproteobacteria bacterium]MBW1736044.1 N-6 DNA methylase [Deltaproteobacteria bacterium]MBW2032543.1 N-6 DNA methylase [Deltaproteobacteria bacterium]MBW2113674.1 N-6 DNA methylase [Deltaproteobacteria bacterium]MBW2167935.1 N-6 DNA methylase [Deltaproteobacteria bacterium]